MNITWLREWNIGTAVVMQPGLLLPYGCFTNEFCRRTVKEQEKKKWQRCQRVTLAPGFDICEPQPYLLWTLRWKVAQPTFHTNYLARQPGTPGRVTHPWCGTTRTGLRVWCELLSFPAPEDEKASGALLWGEQIHTPKVNTAHLKTTRP